MTLNVSCQSLLDCKVSFEKSSDSLMGTPYRWLTAFLLMLLRFFMFHLWHFDDAVSWSGPLCIHLVWDSLCFLDLQVYFLHQIREVFFHYFSNRFPISCSFSSPCGHPYDMNVGPLEVVLEVAYTILVFSDYLFFLAILIGWLLLPYVPNHWFHSGLFHSTFL